MIQGIKIKVELCEDRYIRTRARLHRKHTEIKNLVMKRFKQKPLNKKHSKFV